jgi:hypothetical protein
MNLLVGSPSQSITVRGDSSVRCFINNTEILPCRTQWPVSEYIWIITFWDPVQWLNQDFTYNWCLLKLNLLYSFSFTIYRSLFISESRLVTMWCWRWNILIYLGLYTAYQFGLLVNWMFVPDEDIDHVCEGWQCDTFMPILILKLAMWKHGSSGSNAFPPMESLFERL